MYFENEYFGMVKEKLMSFLSNHNGMFISKEDMLKQFNEFENLSVTSKTFKKWLDSCGFVVTECIVVTPRKENTQGTPTPHILIEDTEEELFDNEDLSDRTKPTERTING